MRLPWRIMTDFPDQEKTGKYRLHWLLLLVNKRLFTVISCHVLVFIQVTGCSSVPIGEVDAISKQQFIDYHFQQAQSSIDSGHYHQALIHIDILNLADPDNSRYKENKRDVINLINHKKSKLLKQSREARNKDNPEQSYRLLLHALSLTPDDPLLIAELRSWSTRQLQEEQTRKQANYASLNKKPASANLQDYVDSKPYNNNKPETDPLANYRQLFEQGRYLDLVDAVAASKPVEVPPELEGWLMQSHLALAIELQQQRKMDAALSHAEKAAAYNSSNHLTTTVKDMQKTLSLVLLENGKSFIRDDIDKAVRILELAKEYDRNNILIKSELAKVQRIKSNLDRIKALN
jgi:hypothetical protein